MKYFGCVKNIKNSGRLTLVWLLLFVVFAFPIWHSAEAVVDPIPKCNPADIEGREPIQKNVIDPAFCPPVATCYYETQDLPPKYNCYQIFVPAPKPSPMPPASSGLLPTSNSKEEPEPTVKPPIPTSWPGGTLGGFIGVLLPYVFGAAGILLLLYIVWGGFDYITSQGNPEEVEKAQKKITRAVLGFVIVVIAYWLVQLLGTILKLEKITEIFG